MTKEEKFYLDRMLDEKDFNEQTSKYITMYVENHTELFGYSVTPYELIDRVRNNLDESFHLLPYPLIDAAYDSVNKKIIYNGMMGSKQRKSVLFHELDHVATTTQILNKRTGNLVIKCGTNHVEFKNSKDAIFEFGTIFNEGITTYKQERFCKMAGLSFETSYKKPLNIVKQVIYIIGENEMIRNHFNNSVIEMAEKMERESQERVNLLDIIEKITFSSPILPIFKERFRKYIQDQLIQGFIAKRCKENNLFYDEDYLGLLNEDRIEKEKGHIEEFMKLSIYDSNKLKNMLRYCNRRIYRENNHNKASSKKKK